MQHPGRYMISERAMNGKSYRWHSKENDFYPLRMPDYPNYWPGVAGQFDTVPATFPTSRLNLLTGAAPASASGAANLRGQNLVNCKHNNWQPICLETGIPHANRHDLCPDHYIKLPRLFNQIGPVILDGRLIVEYECEIECVPIQSPFLNGVITWQAQTGGDSSFAQTTATFGPTRRFVSWGIPPPPVAPLSSGGAYERLYQPATYSGTLSGRSSRKHGARSSPDTQQLAITRRSARLEAKRARSQGRFLPAECIATLLAEITDTEPADTE